MRETMMIVLLAEVKELASAQALASYLTSTGHRTQVVLKGAIDSNQAIANYLRDK